MHKNYIFFPEKKCVPTLPTIFRPVTRNTLIFFIWPNIDLKCFYSSLYMCVCFYSVVSNELAGVDPGFLERGFICIKVWGFALLILSHFS